MEIGQQRHKVLSAMKMSSIVRWASLAIAESQLAFFAVSCGSSASAEREGRATSSGGASYMAFLDQDHLASHLLTERAENEDGLELGSVKDLALDAPTGQAVYVIIASGGTLGFGGQLRAVPVAQVSTATTKLNTLAVNLDGSGWQNLPLLTHRGLAAQFSGRTQDRQARKNLPQPTGREIETSDATPGNNRLELASQLLGHKITNRADEKIGKVTDLLLDLASERSTYAVVSSAMLARSEIFAIPLELLHRENGKLKIDAGRNMFESAPPLDEKAWTAQRTFPGRIYRVENTPPAPGG